ncbi:hypothetical protein CL673_01315 [Candidatus Bathyarchaeota archaeon]|nr:hypothetical protein [Candidatus Bathyarchaeota archaeon]
MGKRTLFLLFLLVQRAKGKVPQTLSFRQSLHTDGGNTHMGKHLCLKVSNIIIKTMFFKNFLGQ